MHSNSIPHFSPSADDKSVPPDIHQHPSHHCLFPLPLSHLHTPSAFFYSPSCLYFTIYLIYHSRHEATVRKYTASAISTQWDKNKQGMCGTLQNTAEEKIKKQIRIGGGGGRRRIVCMVCLCVHQQTAAMHLLCMCDACALHRSTESRSSSSDDGWEC